MGIGMLSYALPFVQCLLTHASFSVPPLAAAGCGLVAAFSGRVDVCVFPVSRVLCVCQCVSVYVCVEGEGGIG